MLKNFRKQFRSMNLEKKIRFFIFISIGLTALIILFASTISNFKLSADTSLSLIESQLQNISDSLSNTLAGCKDIGVAANLDESIQLYLRETGEGNYDRRERARQSAMGILNTHADMDFLVVMKKNESEYVYSGRANLTTSGFSENLHADRENAYQNDSSAMRINFQSLYLDSNPYNISIYYPIYDTRHIGMESGTLCFSISAQALGQVLDAHNDLLDYQLFLIDGNGETAASSNSPDTNPANSFAHEMSSRRGRFEKDGKLYIYSKLDEWDFYAAAAIDKSALYSDGLATALLLILVILLLVSISLLIANRILKRSYQSMKDIVYCMEQVSDGNFGVHMNENTSGEDFIKIAKGFNHMTQKVEQLMNEVKEEQHQIEQIKFNALQSQIKPHFLYNVLECIHWQAAMDKNVKVSKIVKALAEYYRVCLSSGRDIIELSEELRHVTSYITIQNIRYGDIVSLETEIDPGLLSIEIPKMTLQPLIENSIYHGIKMKNTKCGKILITAGIQEDNEDNIVITVEDNGVGMSQTAIDEMNESISVHDESFGYGVRNVHKRIELLFGAEYGLHYRRGKAGGLTVEISLPAKRQHKSLN